MMARSSFHKIEGNNALQGAKREQKKIHPFG